MVWKSEINRPETVVEFPPLTNARPLSGRLLNTTAHHGEGVMTRSGRIGRTRQRALVSTARRHFYAGALNQTE